MRAVFVETTAFTNWIAGHLPDETYAAIQHELMNNPDRGDVMPGCGGLRKLRLSDPGRGKGKRGGARIIYLYVLEAKRFYILDVYGKDEKDDLSTAEKKFLSQLANEVRSQAT